MIERVLPEDVASFAAHEELLDTVLFPVEQRAVEHSVERRRREFTTGRACAREALKSLAIQPPAIPSGPRGEPIWPPGIVGSITHCQGYCACAVARADAYRAVGIDAESHAPLPPDVLDAVASPAEIHRLSAHPPPLRADKLLFSAKEAVFKAWFPLTRAALGFDDADVSMGLDGTFVARLLVAGPRIAGRRLTEIQGRWCVDDDLVVTAVTIPG